MKKSYYKLGFMLIVTSFLMILNSFIFKIFNMITLDVFLIVLLFLTYFLLGFERDRHRYTKSILLETIIFLLTFFLLYYLSGLLFGFAKTGNYFALKTFKSIIFPLLLYIPLKEFLRYQWIRKASEEKWLMLLVTITFIFIDNTLVFIGHPFKFNKEFFLIVALNVLPSITTNILNSYLSYYFGFKPNLLYLYVMGFYSYVIPIVPNPNEYVYAILFFLLPVFFFLKIRNWQKQDQAKIIERERINMKRQESIWFIPLVIFTGILIYFVSGYFRYYAVGIASGSMETVISRGDVVIVDREYGNLEVNDILAYKYENKIIVHRVYKIYDNNNEYYIYTKGDANALYDKYKITKDMIIGVVKLKIPMIGYPTVLLNEIW